MNRTLRQRVAGLALTVGVVAASPAHAQAVCGSPMQTTLVAGQSYAAGIIMISNDASYVYLTYETSTPWLMSEAHVAVATSVDGIPQTKTGNPIPGRFAYNATFDPETSSYVFTIPLASLGTSLSSLFIAAHAIVQAPQDLGGTQTGWGQGTSFPGKNWAMYMNYIVQSCGGGSGGGNS
ncbi:MAG TPA: hypothetical protein VLV86_02440 [Vicinamibacterales bacterium]|nr:hypothetical protein [Vicinamibacterales bacterium]